jgi:fructokinase
MTGAPLPRLGAIEGGGTKFVCAVGSAAGSTATATVPTRDPDATLADIDAFFAAHGPIAALGIGNFGPLDLDRASPGYGRIGTTTKPGWSGIDLPAHFRALLKVPIEIDTDVNAAALAEARIAGLDSLAYVTVGTGIGVGIIAGGKPLQGLTHPEGGHIPVRRHPAHEGFAGVCPFHGDCLEGLASGTAIKAAWGGSLSELPAGHPAFEVEAHYLAQACTTLFLLAGPARIVLGGGVMKHEELFAPVRIRTLDLLGGYWQPAMDGGLVDRIVRPASKESSGLVGAFLLAERALV